VYQISAKSVNSEYKCKFLHMFKQITTVVRLIIIEAHTSPQISVDHSHTVLYGKRKDSLVPDPSSQIATATVGRTWFPISFLITS
jgi:hypothetical protein